MSWPEAFLGVGLGISAAWVMVVFIKKVMA
jgi:hypothetical protein